MLGQRRTGRHGFGVDVEDRAVDVGPQAAEREPEQCTRHGKLDGEVALAGGVAEVEHCVRRRERLHELWALVEQRVVTRRCMLVVVRHRVRQRTAREADLGLQLGQGVGRVGRPSPALSM